MASIQDGGIRIFSVEYDHSTQATAAYSADQLEDAVNTFLRGAGTIEEPVKELVGSPQLWVETQGTSDRVFVLIQYRRVN